MSDPAKRKPMRIRCKLRPRPNSYQWKSGFDTKCVAEGEVINYHLTNFNYFLSEPLGPCPTVTSEGKFEIVESWTEDLNAQPSRHQGEGGALAKVTVSELTGSNEWTVVLIFSENIEALHFYTWTGAISKISGNKVTIINR